MTPTEIFRSFLPESREDRNSYSVTHELTMGQTRFFVWKNGALADLNDRDVEIALEDLIELDMMMNVPVEMPTMPEDPSEYLEESRPAYSAVHRLKRQIIDPFEARMRGADWF
jgi:hypothetical protein